MQSVSGMVNWPSDVLCRCTSRHNVSMSVSSLVSCRGLAATQEPVFCCHHNTFPWKTCWEKGLPAKACATLYQSSQTLRYTMFLDSAGGTAFRCSERFTRPGHGGEGGHFLPGISCCHCAFGPSIGLGRVLYKSVPAADIVLLLFTMSSPAWTWLHTPVQPLPV